MFEDLIRTSLEDSQRVLLASIGNGLFELYMTSYEVNDLEFGTETAVILTIEQYLLRADENGSIEWILLDDEVTKNDFVYRADVSIDEMVKMVAEEAIIFAEEFCKEVSLHYHTL
ncbi:hypothetical protein C6B36_06855 [Helicobacter cinaedi]|uniref:hypothetical protein n=1 Tax=Helicobacter cinaedi TaxID=213 RepID=UPI000CF1ACA3|nr:hypothetical protein [Helicobacter cinaedi]AWK62086.1 hypothetical protein C6B36_06855 [Helicobacter cinaedi]QOQ97278.1 hypothetical protein HW245_06655 [Helicobacter cinaedi]